MNCFLPSFSNEFTLFNDLFRVATAFFEEQVQLSTSLLPFTPSSEQKNSKESLFVRIEDFLLPTVFPERTFTVYPVVEAAKAIPDENIPPLWALALSSLCEKGPLPDLTSPIKDRFLSFATHCIKEITDQPGRETLAALALHESITASKDVSPEEKIRKFYTEIKNLAKEYLYSTDSNPLSSEETVLNLIPAEKNFNPFHVTHIKSLAEVIRKFEEEDLLTTATVLQGLIPNIPVDASENLLAWLENPDNQAALREIQNLNLSGLQLKIVPTKILQYCSLLQDLDLSGNQIFRIKPEAFQGLVNLQILRLYDNRINFIQAEAFQGLDSLLFLFLQNNGITVLPPNIFQGLDSLLYLLLQNNGITVLPPNIFQRLVNLQSLDLENNRINSIQPGAFQGLTSLRTLDLQNNEITVLPPNIFQRLGQLFDLYLSNNQIFQIDTGDFQGLDSLVYLYLQNNGITVLPPNIFQRLGSLERLDLQNNRINSIQPGAFQGLTSLQTLDLQNNGITVLPPNIFQGLNNLWRLNLEDNQLFVIHSNAFEDLPSALRQEIEQEYPVRYDRLFIVRQVYYELILFLRSLFYDRR